MNFCKTIHLYGSLASREHTKLILEDQPQIKRIDASSDLSQLRLLLSAPFSEGSVIPLLQKSGISGFYISP